MLVKERTQIKSYLNPKAKAEKGLAGQGVFATDKIAKGELICMWGGDVVTVEQFESLPASLKHYFLQIEENLLIGPTKEENVDAAEFFNHSCDPNCGIRGQVALVAMRDIEKEEELTFDYAMAETYGQEWECQCGTSTCRKNILGSDPFLPELRKKYDGYFSHWLEKKFEEQMGDLAYQLRFETTGAWGLVTALDLHDCNPETLRDKDKIYEFTIELCDRIGVKRFGEPTIVHFGADERVAGYSLVQLIETSLVSGHFANLTNRIYLDIFSCAYYNVSEVVEFSRKFFEAKNYNSKIYLRH